MKWNPAIPLDLYRVASMAVAAPIARLHPLSLPSTFCHEQLGRPGRIVTYRTFSI